MTESSLSTEPIDDDDQIPADMARQVLARHPTACTHCGGRHSRACPRVRELEFHPNGTIKRVKFWEKFDESDILWPEQLTGE